MEALTWSAKFETGLGEVDEQHRRLVALSNEFGELASNQVAVPRARLEAVIGELAAYAQIHFAEEERLMAAAGVDARFVAAHVGQHHRFLDEVTEMRASHFLDAPDTVRVVFQFLLQWLATHILGSDMQLARQIERLRKGEPAAEAFRAEARSSDGPAALLLGALDDLMRVVAQRNAALAESRGTLEARVAARTKDLTATVAALRATHDRLVETGKLISAAPLAAGLAQALSPPLASVQAKVGALGDHARALLEVVDVAEGLDASLPGTRALAEARRRADVPFVREDLDLLLAETQEELRRVVGQVDDLKAFTSVDAEAVVDLDLASCVQTLLTVIPPAQLEGVSLLARFGAMPRVRCQAAQVSQALLALLKNALQAVRDRPDKVGAVTIRGGMAEEGLFVEVADTGVGMPPEVLAHAMEPFFSTRPPGQGVGLGLATAADCAHAHGGRLEATSEPGEGSVFRLWLPLNLH